MNTKTEQVLENLEKLETAPITHTQSFLTPKLKIQGILAEMIQEPTDEPLSTRLSEIERTWRHLGWGGSLKRYCAAIEELRIVMHLVETARGTDD